MILSHPFRLESSGVVAVVADGTTRANAEGVAVIAGTIRGEREVVPDFGVTDPAFGHLDPVEVQVCLNLYGPAGVVVTRVNSTPVDDRTAKVTLSFEENQT